MVKAGKHTLALAARYSPISTASSRKNDMKRPMSLATVDVCQNNEARSMETSPALKCIRAEFCNKYKRRIQDDNDRRCREAIPESQELRTLYRKLRDVIPSLSQPQPQPQQPVTSLDVVLSAIDYIRDLHTMLGDKCPPPPGISNVTSQANASFQRVSGVTRIPLTQLENKRPALQHVEAADHERRHTDADVITD